MIQTAADMFKALRRGRFTGVILYRGPSMLDGAPIAVIACRIDAASDNAKTGAMVQTFIIRSDLSPLAAIDTGLDASICGSCIHRGNRETGAARTCYVNVGRSVMAVYGALSRGRYAEPGTDYDPSILPDLFEGSAFRAGTYGDPAAAPFEVWAHASAKARARTGYTHQWRDARFSAFRSLCMASADSVTDKEEAEFLGWRTFRVRAKGAPVLRGEVTCPASKEAGAKTTCAECKACGGTSARARAPIVIEAHGSTGGLFQ